MAYPWEEHTSSITICDWLQFSLTIGPHCLLKLHQMHPSKYGMVTKCTIKSNTQFILQKLCANEMTPNLQSAQKDSTLEKLVMPMWTSSIWNKSMSTPHQTLHNSSMFFLCWICFGLLSIDLMQQSLHCHWKIHCCNFMYVSLRVAGQHCQHVNEEV